MIRYPQTNNKVALLRKPNDLIHTPHTAPAFVALGFLLKFLKFSLAFLVLNHKMVQRQATTPLTESIKSMN